MDQDITATAHFDAIPYTLDVHLDGNGSVTVDPEQLTYAYGDQVTLTADPDPEWQFNNWSGDATGENQTIVITIFHDCTVTAHFESTAPKLDKFLYLPLLIVD